MVKKLDVDEMSEQEMQPTIPLEGLKTPLGDVFEENQGVSSHQYEQTQKEPLKRKSKRGRPKKTEVAALKRGNRVQRGRPAGDAAIINEYKARMLNSPKSAKVLEKIFDAALTDGHPGQTAAWKLVIDRVAPLSAFDTKSGNGNAPQISINISGLNSPTVSTDTIDVDVTDVEDNNDLS